MWQVRIELRMITSSHDRSECWTVHNKCSDDRINTCQSPYFHSYSSQQHTAFHHPPPLLFFSQVWKMLTSPSQSGFSRQKIIQRFFVWPTFLSPQSQVDAIRSWLESHPRSSLQFSNKQSTPCVLLTFLWTVSWRSHYFSGKHND